jgi:hypothetical protein
MAAYWQDEEWLEEIATFKYAKAQHVEKARIKLAENKKRRPLTPEQKARWEQKKPLIF